MRFERVRSLCIPCAAVALGVACAAALGDEVTDRSKDANLWAAPGADQSLTRHSSLTQCGALVPLGSFADYGALG